MMTVFRSAAAIGVLVGVIGVAAAPVPTVRLIEDTSVLPALFHVRGVIAPPREVVVVTMDERSAATLGYGMPQREWPRRAHATLVSRLVEQGAASIAFDVQFFTRSADGNDDAVFAAAVRQARRVVFAERVEALKVGASQVWQRQGPIAVLKDASVATAPVPLPDTPIVSWTWLFLATPQGEVPSLPAVALQAAAMAQTESLASALRQRGLSIPASAPTGSPVDIPALIETFRRFALEHRSEVEAAAQRSGDRWVRALTSLYMAPPTAYLNFYGPPGTVCSVPFYEVIAPNQRGSSRCSLNGAIVFVGAGVSKVERAGQPDTYHAVYSGTDGVDFSGVELHATAAANLLDGSSLAVLPASFILLFVWGSALGAGSFLLRSGRVIGVGSSKTAAAVCLLGAAMIYAIAAYVCFARLHLLVPLAVPIAVQVPTAALIVLMLRARASHQQVLAVCLATDAAGSTELGQRIPHDQYARVMRHYIARLSGCVTARSGDVLDPQGDGFVCVWRCSGATRATRLEACLAALDVLDAADSLDREAGGGIHLPTRVAATMGMVTLHSDGDRGTFQAYGDPLNLAARLRDLNKQFGTRFIASADVVEGLEDALLLKPLIGDYVLKGFARPPAIFEVRRVTTTVAHHARA